MSVLMSHFWNLISITLGTIVFPLQRLKVRNVITTTFCFRDNMVYFPSIFIRCTMSIPFNNSTTSINPPNFGIFAWKFFSVLPYQLH